MPQSAGQSETALVSQSGETIATTVEIADSWWQRFKGLQFRKQLPDGHAILLRPCSSIHTFWMRFSIDVVFLDGDLCVIEIHRDVRPWRTLIPQTRSVAVLEMSTGSLPVCIRPGDVLAWSAIDTL
ncbi:MAG: DUF192 domain-containing protein [Planctomycetaceae bacterium]|nr:DUF192 domain-containing protein [Planctomycetaceae bacterium]